MKVVQHTPNTLVLRWFSHLPWFNAAATVLLGCLILSLGGQMTTLDCQRSGEGNGQCELKTRQILGSRVQSIPVDQLQGAKLQRDQKDKPRELYRVLLVTPSQEIPVTPHFSADYLTRQNAVEQLEMFIEDDRSTPLVIRDYGHAWIYFLGGAAVIVGLASAVVGIERTTITFDHDTNSLKIHHQRLFAGWTDEYNLQTITNVEIGCPPTTVPQFNSQLQKLKKASSPCVNIQFESGNRLPISLDPKEQPIKQAVREIRDFLHLSRSKVS